MVDGHNEDVWARTSLLAFLLAEPNRDAGKHPEPYTPDTFNPLVSSQEIEPVPDGVWSMIGKSLKFAFEGTKKNGDTK